jgi:uncharacterized membrane protein YgcG
MMMTIKIVLAISAIVGTIWALRALQKSRDTKIETRSAFIRNYMFPGGLRFKMCEQFPQLSDAQIDTVFDGLRAWFLLLAQYPKQRFGMPSAAVDTAWHEFILMTRNYESFCQKAFGRFLHHVPNELGRAGDDKAALARTHAMLPTVAGIALLGTGAASASLFAVDQTLNVPNGNLYDQSDLDELSRRHREQLAQNSSGNGGGCGGTSVDGSSGCGGDGGGGGGCGGGCGS